IINIDAVCFFGIDAVTAVIEYYIGVIQWNDFLSIPAYDTHFLILGDLRQQRIPKHSGIVIYHRNPYAQLFIGIAPKTIFFDLYPAIIIIPYIAVLRWQQFRQ